MVGVVEEGMGQGQKLREVLEVLGLREVQGVHRILGILSVQGILEDRDCLDILWVPLVRLHQVGQQGLVVQEDPLDLRILSIRGILVLLGVQSILVVLLVPLVRRLVEQVEVVVVVVDNTGNTFSSLL